MTLHIDSVVRGGLQGTLRLALRGFPTDGGGVTMTSSGVAFAAKGTPVFEGSIVGLDGTNVNAEVTSSSGTYRLALTLNVDNTTNAITGTVQGRRAVSPTDVTRVIADGFAATASPAPVGASLGPTSTARGAPAAARAARAP